MTNLTQIAGDRFAEGFNCSQAVLSAFASRLGISVETALKIASPFGGGIARQGHVCGALTGALMVLGLQRGNATVDGKDATYRLAEEFVHRFAKQHGAVLCRELIGYGLSKPEGLKAAREHDVFRTICPGLVKDTTEAVSEFLTE